jgi:hypothetical protein
MIELIEMSYNTGKGRKKAREQIRAAPYLHS